MADIWVVSTIKIGVEKLFSRLFLKLIKHYFPAVPTKIKTMFILIFGGAAFLHIFAYNCKKLEYIIILNDKKRIKMRL